MTNPRGNHNNPQKGGNMSKFKVGDRVRKVPTHKDMGEGTVVAIVPYADVKWDDHPHTTCYLDSSLIPLTPPAPLKVGDRVIVNDQSTREGRTGIIKKIEPAKITVKDDQLSRCDQHYYPEWLNLLTETEEPRVRIFSGTKFVLNDYHYQPKGTSTMKLNATQRNAMSEDDAAVMEVFCHQDGRIDTNSLEYAKFWMAKFGKGRDVVAIAHAKIAADKKACNCEQA